MRRALVSILAAVLLVACDAMPREGRPDDDEMHVSEEFSVPGREVLWVLTTREIENLGFELDGMSSDPARGTFETHWRNELAPHRYEGFRTRIIGRIVESEQRPGRYSIHATAWVQKNADMDDPLDPSRAIWQGPEPNDDLVRELFFRVRRHF